MFRSKLVKTTVAFMVAASLGLSMVACSTPDSSDEDNEEEIEETEAEEETSAEGAVENGDVYFWQEQVDDPTEMFMRIVSDIPAFVETVDAMDEDYTTYSYYYFDYNHDDIVEPIIVARFVSEEGHTLNRLCYLCYDSENSVVAIQAIVLDSQGTTILYCDLDTYFTRVSSFPDRNETWVYYVDIWAEGNLSYVMSDDFMSGEYFENPEDYGMTILPEYESGELIPFES